MVNTSDRPIVVDGVRLDTLGWNIEKINRATAARRDASSVVPGRDGVIPSLNDSLEPATFGLEMFVRGTDEDGAIPSGVSGRDQFWTNLDELIHLFGKRHGLLEVWEQTGPGSMASNLSPTPRVPAWLPNSGTWSVFTNVPASGSAHPLGFTTWSSVRRTAGAVPDPTVFGSTYNLDGLQGTGVVRRVGAWVKTNVASRVNLYLTGNAQAANVTVTLAADTWTWIAPPAAGSGHTVMGISRVTGNALETDAAWIAGVIATSDSTDTPLAYFDGGTVWDTLHEYAWTGAANISPSIRRPRSVRRAWAKVADTITPDVNESGGAGRFAVALELPYAAWEDVTTQDWAGTTGAASGTVQTVTTLQGATERITDGVFLVEGPAINPRLTDPATGHYVQLNRTLTAGQSWRVNAGTWTTRWGSVGLSSADTVGTDAQAETTYGGTPNVASFLTLTPTRSGGTRQVSIVLTGTGFTAATRTRVRARRKFAL